MPLLLRRLKGKHPTLWDPKTYISDCKWLRKGEIPGDLFTDWEIKTGCASVWLIEDDKSNLDAVQLSLMLIHDEPRTLSYILFDTQILDLIGIVKKKSNSFTRFTPEVGNTWHYDLQNLSGSKLLALVKAVSDSNITREIKNKKVLGRIVQEIDNGILSSDELHEKWNEKISMLPAPS